MNKLQTLVYGGIGSLALASQTFAAITNPASAGITVKSVNTGLVGNGSSDVVAVVVAFVTWVIGLLGLVGVIMAVYAGFLIVTAGGDEEKVKKGKHILMQVAIGIIVVFLASTFVYFAMNIGTDGVGNTSGTV